MRCEECDQTFSPSGTQLIVMQPTVASAVRCPAGWTRAQVLQSLGLTPDSRADILDMEPLSETDEEAEEEATFGEEVGLNSDELDEWFDPAYPEDAEDEATLGEEIELNSDELDEWFDPESTEEEVIVID